MAKIGVDLSEDPDSLGDGVWDISPLEGGVGDVDGILVEIEVGQVEQMKILTVSFFEFLVENVEVGSGGNQDNGDPGGHIKGGFKLFHLSLLIIIYSL